MSSSGIRLRGVEKRYSDSVHIGPVTVDFPQGGVTALVGPNGAGKSTLLTMIGRLLGLDEGQISVAGWDVSTTRSEDLAKVLSVLRQDNHFITKLTVHQLVSFGRFPYYKGRLTSEDVEIVEKYLEFFNLTDLAQRYLDQLSGGQRQRAYVAMVLAQETDYVLLDEPLNNLDIAHSARMMRHLRTAADELGRTIIVVLHDINAAAAHADRICSVKNGQVVALDDVAQIMDSEILTEIFDSPIEVVETSRGKIAYCW